MLATSVANTGISAAPANRLRDHAHTEVQPTQRPEVGHEVTNTLDDVARVNHRAHGNAKEARQLERLTGHHSRRKPHRLPATEIAFIVSSRNAGTQRVSIHFVLVHRLVIFVRRHLRRACLIDRALRLTGSTARSLLLAITRLIDCAVGLVTGLVPRTTSSRTGRAASIATVALVRSTANATSAGPLARRRLLTSRGVAFVVSLLPGRPIRLHTGIVRRDSAKRLAVQLTELTRTRLVGSLRTRGRSSLVSRTHLVSLNRSNVAGEPVKALRARDLRPKRLLVTEHSVFATVATNRARNYRRRTELVSLVRQGRPGPTSRVVERSHFTRFLHTLIGTRRISAAVRATAYLPHGETVGPLTILATRRDHANSGVTKLLHGRDRHGDARVTGLYVGDVSVTRTDSGWVITRFVLINTASSRQRKRRNRQREPRNNGLPTAPAQQEAEQAQ